MPETYHPDRDVSASGCSSESRQRDLVVRVAPRRGASLALPVRSGDILRQLCPDIVFLRRLGNSVRDRYHCGSAKKQQDHGRETIKPFGRQTSHRAGNHSTGSAAASVERAWLCRPAFHAANLHREDRTTRHRAAGSGDRHRDGCDFCFSARRVPVLDPRNRPAGRSRDGFRGFENASAEALTAAQASGIGELQQVDTVAARDRRRSACCHVPSLVFLRGRRAARAPIRGR